MYSLSRINKIIVREDTLTLMWTKHDVKAKLNDEVNFKNDYIKLESNLMRKLE